MNYLAVDTASSLENIWLFDAINSVQKNATYATLTFFRSL